MNQEWYGRAIRALCQIESLHEASAARALMAGLPEGTLGSVFRSGDTVSVRYALMLMDLEAIDVVAETTAYVIDFLRNAQLHTPRKQISQELQQCIDVYQARRNAE